MSKTDVSHHYSYDSLEFFTSELFKAVQMAKVFDDSKTFADAVPKIPFDDILIAYESACQNKAGVDLATFINRYFIIPEQHNIASDKRGADVEQHIEILWSLLEKPADKMTAGTLLPLKSPYLVPGGRFREVYYWDSYFTALGLIASGRIARVEAMLANFIDLQSRYGCIPNGNRSYYLSRSQPPILALLIELLLPFKKDDMAFLTCGVNAIETEYSFWMQGRELLTDGHGEQARVVKMPDGSLLNRYWDDNATPRPESYREDIELAQGLSATAQADCYRHVRAACESGWDFSSRWLADASSLASIRTCRILPIDLNCLLYKQETLLASYYSLLGNDAKSAAYAHHASQRKTAIMRYMWSDKQTMFVDYDLDTGSYSPVTSLAGVLPLFVGIADKIQANNVANVIETQFLKAGGLITTTSQSEQQWDTPNGWAPLHWFAVRGLINYEHHALASIITTRWLHTVQHYFAQTGKIMEKYNVCEQTQKASGGEYDVQEGFGWTNGVCLAFYRQLTQQDPLN